MVVSDTPVAGDATPMPAARRPTAPDRLREALDAGVDLGRQLPGLVAAAVMLGIAFAVASTPIGSGDYGQWLMTSRALLGETVPAYRDLGGVPPVVPLLIAIVRTLIPDPVAALHATAVLLILALGGALYLLGDRIVGGRWAGVLAVVFGLLVTDRFTELFAFGGLLQAGAVALAMLSVAAFVRAASAPTLELRTWWLGVLALAVAAITHVGTATIVVPIGGVVAGIALLARPERDFGATLRRLRLPLIALAAIGIFWLFVLRVETTDFVANPASLAYRGPDRLWALLLERWPTTLILIIGTGAILLGLVSAMVRRRIDGWVSLAAWGATTWAVLAYAVVTGSATDYPRFATLLLVPVVVGAAAAALWALRALSSYVGGLSPRVAELVVPVVVIGLIVGVAPLAIERHARQASFYAIRDGPGLAAAAEWIDARLDPTEIVVADTREAKWIEGLTGRATLFSQAVRYAFRPGEWQRSVEADALLRSSETMTTGLVAAQFTDVVGPGAGASTTGLTLRFNHGGEMVDLLQVAPDATTLTGRSGTAVNVADLVPAGILRGVGDHSIRLVTRWSETAGDTVLYSQTVNAWADGSSLRITQRATGGVVSTDFGVMPGLALSSLEIDSADGSAVACFTQLGSSEPCIRILAVQADAELAAVGAGIQVRTTLSERLDILVTALTAGEPAVGLQLLEPARIAEARQVGAALLYAADPASGSRARRLEAIGFTEGPSFGPYRVLVRDGNASP